MWINKNGKTVFFRKSVNMTARPLIKIPFWYDSKQWTYLYFEVTMTIYWRCDQNFLVLYDPILKFDFMAELLWQKFDLSQKIKILIKNWNYCAFSKKSTQKMIQMVPKIVQKWYQNLNIHLHFWSKWNFLFKNGIFCSKIEISAQKLKLGHLKIIKTQFL